MSIQIIVYSRDKFSTNTPCNDNNVSEFINDYFICINATGNIHSEPFFKKDHSNVLNMYFDDVVEDTVKYFGPTDSEFKCYAKACTVSQAKQMYEFIGSIADNSRLHIYCTKGKSRSVAVAKYVNEFINGIPTTDNGHNILVYELLKCLNLK